MIPRRPGEPGEPGEPGKAGVEGGGAGGRGGRGGSGGPGEDYRWMAVVAFVAVLAIGISVGTLVIASDARDNAHRITQLTKDLRTATLIQCARGNVLRGQMNHNEILIRQALTESPGVGSAALRDAVAEMKTVPPIDCVQAVDHPRTYQAPAPQQIPPYRSGVR